jgi:hypothetical protein
MFHFLLTNLGRVVTGAAFSVVKWSDCTRRKNVGQYHKNCAMVEFSAAG